MSELDNKEKHLNLIQSLADYKSAGNIDGALTIYSSDIRLETPGFAKVASGSTEVREQLQQFFAAFPDYSVTIRNSEPFGKSGEQILSTGTITMTLNKDLFSFSSPHVTASTAVRIIFGFVNDRINFERFEFNTQDLLEQYLLTSSERSQLEKLLISETEATTC